MEDAGQEHEQRTYNAGTPPPVPQYLIDQILRPVNDEAVGITLGSALLWQVLVLPPEELAVLPPPADTAVPADLPPPASRSNTLSIAESEFVRVINTPQT